MMRAPSLVLSGVCLLALASFSETDLHTTEGSAPRFLSETGLYSDITTLTVDKLNRHYSPQYPLWSDGAGKSRWVFIPPGTTIDVHDIDSWVFPVGTKFWKEFAFDGHKVETRLIWRVSADHWVFASYAWQDDSSDAILAAASGVRNAHEIAPGKMHDIPSVQDCKACHESRRIEILGFDALQLSTDRDPNAPNAESLKPNMTTLKTLIEDGVLQPVSEDLLEHPPRIRTNNPQTRAALGYLSANCGGCHNPENPLAYRGIDLKHTSGALSENDEPGLRTTLDQKGRYIIRGIPAGETRLIHAGRPEYSSILTRMRSRRPSSQMPPLGTVIVDQNAVELIRRWIASDLVAKP